MLFFHVFQMLFWSGCKNDLEKDDVLDIQMNQLMFS